jgi:hypothetical protein
VRLPLLFISKIKLFCGDFSISEKRWTNIDPNNVEFNGQQNNVGSNTWTSTKGTKERKEKERKKDRDIYSSSLI